MHNNHYPYDDINWIYDDRLKRTEKRFSRILLPDYGDNIQGKSYYEATAFLEMAAAAFIAERPKAECLKYLALAHQFSVMHFQGTLHAGANFDYIVNGLPFSIVGKRILPHMSVHVWDDSINLALCLRDKAAIEHLVQFDSIEYDQKAVETLPFEHAYCDFVKALFNPKANLQALLNEVIRLSAPEHMPERRQEYIYNIRLPYIEVILAVLANNEADYHKAISNALARHIKHYDNKKRSDISTGWLALNLCAVAAMAYDQCGFKLPEPNAYMPEWLVYGDFERVSYLFT